MDVPMDHHMWGTMLKHYKRHMPKLANIMPSWKTILSTIQNDFNRVLLQLVGTDIENSLFKYRVIYRHLTFMIETFEVLMKSCEKNWFVIRAYSMFTWKSEL